MTDFTIRSDSVDVEQIMGRIRARIREKRGVDYTEQDLQELAAVKLEKFLDPEGVRSDLLAEFKKASKRPPIAPPPPPEPAPSYTFEDYTIYETHRSLLLWARRLFNPVLKLLFNPNPLIQALNIQTKINARHARIEAETAKRAYELDRIRVDREILSYEVLHNLVVELTRLGIEVKNLKMRVESLSSRLDFDERRARALEGVVEYRKDAAQPPTVVSSSSGAVVDADLETEPAGEAQPASPAGEASRGRRRRRRRGRRGGRRGGVEPTGPIGLTSEPQPPSSAPEGATDPVSAAGPEAAETTEPVTGDHQPEAGGWIPSGRDAEDPDER